MSNLTLNPIVARTAVPPAAPPQMPPMPPLVPDMQVAPSADVDHAEEMTEILGAGLRERVESGRRYSHAEYLEQLEYWSEDASVDELVGALLKLAAGDSSGAALMAYLQRCSDPLEAYLLVQAALRQAGRAGDAARTLQQAARGLLDRHRTAIESGLAVGRCLLDSTQPPPPAEGRVLRGWVDRLLQQRPLIDTVFKMVSECGTAAEFQDRTKSFLLRVGPELCRLSPLADPFRTDQLLKAIKLAHELLFALDVVEQKVRVS
jgi:hypothetical protein